MMRNNEKRSSKLIPEKRDRNIKIGEREINILKDLARYRYLTADQISRLHFPKGSQSYCNERLRFLFHKPYRLINREPLPIEWGKGSPKLAYSLTKTGADLLKKNGFYADYSYQKAYKLKNSGAVYKKHEIAINEFSIAVELAVKNYGGRIEKQISETEFKDPGLLRQMKVFDLETGLDIPIAPDWFFAVSFPESGRKALFFLEMDRGTMELKRFRFKKIRGYHLFGEKWRNLDIFREYSDFPYTFRVLTVVDGGIERTNNLKMCAEKEFMGDDEEERVKKGRRFYFTELANITPDTVLLGKIWLVAFKSRNAEERYPLFLTKPEKSP